MSQRASRIALFAVLIMTVAALAGCQQTPPGAQEAVDQIKAGAEAKQAAVDQAINAVQKSVGEAADKAGGLEAQVKGLQIKSDLQQIQRDLEGAIGQTADKKAEAVRSIAATFDGIIVKIENAAAEAPAGGQLQTDLNELAGKLRAGQAALAAAVGSASGSSPSSSSVTTP